MEDNSGRKPDPTRWLTRPMIVAAVSILLVAGIAAAVLVTKHHKQTSSAVPVPPSRTPTPKPIAVTAQKPFTLQSTDSDPSKRFSTADGQAWDLDWSYDCTKRGGQGMFIVSIYDGTGHPSKETPPVIESGAKGSGTKNYTKSGTHFFGVRSVCTWHLAAKAAS